MEWIPKIEERRHFCHKCRGEVVFEVKMQRTDACPHCGADLHACNNCEHWDPGAYNECKEHISEYVPDREATNRCTFFTFRASAPEETKSRIDASKSKLDALFEKK